MLNFIITERTFAMHENNSDTIIEKYSSLIYRVALNQLRNRADADDIFQEVFLRYYKKQRTFCSEEHEKAWFIRVTINLCKSLRTQAYFRYRADFNECEDVSFEFPEEDLLHLAITEISTKYSSVIHLFYFEGYSTDEIAQILKVSPNTVRTRLSRGRKMLKEKLEKHNDTLNALEV